MNTLPMFDRRLETIAWGLLFIWWGLSIFFDRIPFGAALVGTGLILLGVNAVRSRKGIQTRGMTTACGILALVWGGLELLRSVPHSVIPLPFVMNDWAIFSLLLVVVGLMFLGAVLRAGRMPEDPGSRRQPGGDQSDDARKWS